MKKFIFLLLFFLLTSQIFASDVKIKVVPETVPINESLYVIFQWENELPISDFNVELYSKGVEFENNTLHYAGIAPDTRIIKFFNGKAVRLGNHTIIISVDYWEDGYHIYKKYKVNVSIIPKTIVKVEKEIIEKVIIKNVTVNYTQPHVEVLNVINETQDNITVNISPNTTENKTQLTNTVNKTHFPNTTQNPTINAETQDSVPVRVLYYIMGGLLLGFIVGLIIMYVNKF